MIRWSKANGRFSATGKDKELTWVEVAGAAYVAKSLPAGLEPELSV